MKFINIALFITALLWLSGCADKEDFSRHKSGLEYRYIEHNPDARRPVKGEILELDVLILSKDGKELYDTREIPGSFRMKLKSPAHEGGSIEDAYTLMHEGDSLHCRIKAGDFYRYSRKQHLPDGVKAKEPLTFHIKLHKIYSGKEYSKLQEQWKKERRLEEKSYLQKYLMRNNIDKSPRPSGLYFISMEKGDGVSPQPGDSVKVHYKGFLIEGDKFDSSYARNKPLTIKLGANDVIPGWEEGIALMHKGGKAKLIIPSHLAYGDQGYGESIPPYSTLIFEIELLDVF